MSVSREFETKEVLARRENLKAEINKACYKTKEQSSEKWKKTPEERVLLANLKLQLFEALRKAGHNVKKRMNTSEPFHAVIS